MKKSLVLLGALMALLLASACSTTPSGSPDENPPASSASQTTEPTSATQNAPEPSAPQEAPAAAPSEDPPPASDDDCVPAGTGIPASVQDFECLNLTSVSGTDATGEITWLGTDPFTLVTMVRDGNVAFSSKTPCNTLMSSVQVTDTQFVVDPNMAMTMMACQSPQSDYEKWVATFFSAPLNYTLNPDSLVLGNDHGTVTFKIPVV
ncbi:hypothetical protein ART_3041 [Arthrobacter sp. PAMC 25486]|uniref:META domain-containing protein n=1 Tax=Arthrobacter sp. PAMC 25486 TaxID=1494608 RepID=UPI000536354A|nr:META domain-containing protein [Arthrobacter sp. PAMC 25486]AIY02640.1 hypothetical protein ART_3041 [Arthrobacter sp. PAMC 25486]